MGSSCSSPCQQKLEDFIHDNMFMPPPVDMQIFEMVDIDPDASLCEIVGKDNQKISYMKIQMSSKIKKWIVFSHGNAATIFNYYYYAKQLCNDLGVGCIFYDYPGYGFSSGTPTDLHIFFRSFLLRKNFIAMR